MGVFKAVGRSDRLVNLNVWYLIRHDNEYNESFETLLTTSTRDSFQIDSRRSA